LALCVCFTIWSARCCRASSTAITESCHKHRQLLRRSHLKSLTPVH
jgi:hypothetical protein